MSLVNVRGKVSPGGFRRGCVALPLVLVFAIGSRGFVCVSVAERRAGVSRLRHSRAFLFGARSERTGRVPAGRVYRFGARCNGLLLSCSVRWLIHVRVEGMEVTAFWPLLAQADPRDYAAGCGRRPTCSGLEVAGYPCARGAGGRLARTPPRVRGLSVRARSGVPGCEPVREGQGLSVRARSGATWLVNGCQRLGGAYPCARGAGILGVELDEPLGDDGYPCARGAGGAESRTPGNRKIHGGVIRLCAERRCSTR